MHFCEFSDQILRPDLIHFIIIIILFVYCFPSDSSDFRGHIVMLYRTISATFPGIPPAEVLWECYTFFT